MKVYIRNKRTAAYYASPGRWVASASAACDFHNAHAAIETAGKEHLTGSEVVISADNTGAEIVLPLRPKKRAREGNPSESGCSKPEIGNPPDGPRDDSLR